MPKTIKEERLRWVLPIVNKEIKLKDVAKVCPYSKRSLERWLAAHKKNGEAGLEPKSTRPKTNYGRRLRFQMEILKNIRELFKLGFNKFS